MARSLVTRIMLCAFLWFVWGWIAGRAASDTFEHVAAIHREDSFDFGGVQFYQLALGAQGRITVSADGDTKLARWLTEHDQKRILMRFEVTPEQERLSR